MDSDIELEQKTRAIGQDLYAGISGVPPVFDTGRWLGRLMDQAMKNEDFKIRLFRFIDVLPSLKNDALVMGLLREYFRDGTESSKMMGRAIRLVPEKGLGTRLASPVIRKGVASIGRQFIAGIDPRNIVKTLQAVTTDGTGFTVDLLGEVVVSDREAEAHTERYLELLELLHAAFPGTADVSLKVSSFYSQLDPVDWEGSLTRTKDGLRRVFRRAKETGISLTFDMEHYHCKNLVIAIFKSIAEEEEFKELPRIGIAVQAYLKETERDVIDLIRWARERRRKIAVRLVKGAYWDYEIVVSRQKGWPVPVFLQKQETDMNFERLTRLLFENRDSVRPCVATHNLRSIAHAIALSESLPAAKGEFEFQMLYGMAEPLRKAVRGQGFDVRVYTPVGELIPGMAYLVRRLLENTSNASFLKNSFRDGRSFDQLIGKPAEPGQGTEQTGALHEFKNEPLLDFSIEPNRRSMHEAVRNIKEELNGFYPLLIGDERVRTAKEIISRNPARPDEVVGRVSSATRKECDDALREALKARDQWRTTPPGERAEYLFKAAGEMRKQRLQFAALEVIEVGKTWKDADGDVAEAIDYLEYYGREMIRLANPKKMGAYPGEENEYFYAPKGIAAVIAPWNFPLAIAAGMASAALVAGNCVIFKPSGLSPVTGFRLCDIFRTAGLPPGVLQFLPGPGSEAGEYLVSHPSVDLIAFTGSKEVGLRIVRLAAETGKGQRNVKKVIAELGGKNAVIVDATADIDEAVKGVVESAFGYQGQKCSACSRVIVAGPVYQEFCSRLSDAVRSLRIGPPEDPSNSMGPMIDEAALRKVRDYIEIGKQEAKELVIREAPDEGYFAGPAVFIDVPPDSRIATEEIFGPVLSVMQAKDIDEAIDLANRSQYALTGGLFSRSPDAIRKVKNEFLTGNLYINRKITGALVGRQPFGGFGMSGVGSKAGGPDYLLQFMNPISITENTMRRGFAPLEEETQDNY